MGVIRFLRSLCITSLLVSPCVAQFGVGGKRKKKAASFEELNEQAKNDQKGGAGSGLAGLAGLEGLGDMDFGNLAGMLEDAMKDPKMVEQLSLMGNQLEEAMGELSKLSPEELEKQMSEAFKMLTDTDMVSNIMDKKDEVLESLVDTGLVPPEELAKYKADPTYFEKKIKESFGQMKGIFDDPEMLKLASKTVTGITQELYSEGGLMDELSNTILADLDDDDKIEEARLKLLTDPELAGNPTLAAMFQSDEMKEILKDPKKWRDQVKQGQSMLKDIGAKKKLTEGAGVGEL